MLKECACLWSGHILHILSFPNFHAHSWWIPDLDRFTPLQSGPPAPNHGSVKTAHYEKTFGWVHKDPNAVLDLCLQ